MSLGSITASVLAALALAGHMPPSISGTTWELVELKPGRNAITLNASITHPTLRFDGLEVTGNTGCSPLKGAAQAGANRLHFGPLDAGDTAHCPDRIIDLRENYLDLLRHTQYFWCSGDTLTLWGGGGWLRFRAKP